jgi:hypothetical protein
MVGLCSPKVIVNWKHPKSKVYLIHPNYQKNHLAYLKHVQNAYVNLQLANIIKHKAYFIIKFCIIYGLLCPKNAGNIVLCSYERLPCWLCGALGAAAHLAGHYAASWKHLDRCVRIYCSHTIVKLQKMDYFKLRTACAFYLEYRLEFIAYFSPPS